MIKLIKEDFAIRGDIDKINANKKPTHIEELLMAAIFLS